ncbi:hypothetical protein MNAN1_003434 [Malassezia nana]|uniref:Uncharacterized protein n=1 Tax=Malassezia nana TaxID=180528 RepID=A0AAF0ENV0_9BASI|nr:hypothetical protein MNAN1_003434 [Malassezia nana]
MTAPLSEPDSSRRKWERLPTPPSTGHADAITITSSNQQRTTLVPVSDEHAEQELHQHKRVCRRDSHVLTPPSTRGRRMHDKLGLNGPSAEAPRRHQRHCSDSVDSLWMMDGMELGCIASSQDREQSPAGNKWLMHSLPVRDTPHNPFVEGGPADVGFTGPNASNALMRAMARPVKSPSKTMFVFRGQRVVYATRERGQAARQQASMCLSPPRPHLLFPPRRGESALSAPPAMTRHALSDDETESPSKKRAGANLFAQELANRRYRSVLPTVPQDTEAEWLASERPGGPAPVEWPSQPPAAKYELPAKNKELLARLERVDWTEEDAQSDESWSHVMYQ